MYEENRKSAFNDYEQAKAYLESIGEYERIKATRGAISQLLVIKEANRIKANQIILTE